MTFDRPDTAATAAQVLRLPLAIEADLPILEASWLAQPESYRKNIYRLTHLPGE